MCGLQVREFRDNWHDTAIRGALGDCGGLPAHSPGWLYLNNCQANIQRIDSDSFLTGKPFTFIAPTTPPGLIIALHPTHSRLVAEPSSPWLGAHVVLVFTRRLRSSPRASLVEPPKGDGDDYVAKTRHPCRRRDHRNWGGMAQLQGALI